MKWGLVYESQQAWLPEGHSVFFFAYTISILYYTTYNKLYLFFDLWIPVVIYAVLQNISLTRRLLAWWREETGQCQGETHDHPEAAADHSTYDSVKHKALIVLKARANRIWETATMDTIGSVWSQQKTFGYETLDSLRVVAHFHFTSRQSKWTSWLNNHMTGSQNEVTSAHERNKKVY